jgi:hypothetical protein
MGKRITIYLSRSEKATISNTANNFSIPMSQVVSLVISRDRSPLPPFRLQRLIISDMLAELQAILCLDISLSPTTKETLSQLTVFLQTSPYRPDFSINDRLAPHVSRSPEEQQRLYMHLSLANVDALDAERHRHSETRNQLIRQKLTETDLILPKLYDLPTIRSFRSKLQAFYNSLATDAEFKLSEDFSDFVKLLRDFFIPTIQSSQ